MQDHTREYLNLEQAGWKSVAIASSWELGSIDQIWIYPSVNWSTTSWYNNLALPSGLSDHSPVGAEIRIYPYPFISPTPTLPVPTPSLLVSPVLSSTLTSPQVVRFKGFDDSCAFSKWGSRWTTEKISDGVLGISGEEPWQATATRFNVFSEGQGVMVHFQDATDSEFEIYLDSRVIGTEPYKRFGIHVQGNRVQVVVWRSGTDQRIEKLNQDLEMAPATWYTLILAIGKQGEMLAQVWDPNKPTQVFKYSLPTNEDWAGQPWVFRIGANKGKILIDDLTELSFDQIIH